MKLSVILLCGACGCFAQTNTITFTNASGVVSNAEPIRVDHSKLIYRTPSGGGGTIKLKDLPPDLQQRFGFNPAEAAADEKAETDQRQARALHRELERAAALNAYQIDLGAATRTGKYDSDPFRLYEGRIVDFSDAIKWLASTPPEVCPYPVGSQLYRDWESRKQQHETEGMRWERFLVRGTVAEAHAEGLIVNVPVTVVVESGSVRRGLSIYPTYSTVHTTKQVLLKNAPAVVTLPVFAIPAGGSRSGLAILESFDYGTPMIRGVNGAVGPGIQQGLRTPAFRNGFAVQSLTARVTEQNNTWWRYAYKLTVQNTGSDTTPQWFKIQFLDGDGYVIDTASTDRTVIAPQTTETITGDILIRTPGAGRVSQFKAIQD